jgi:hypothetical protein
MTADDKRRFINQMTDSIRQTMLDQIPKMPEDWDGHELRELLADISDYNRSHLMREIKSARVKNYRNEYAVRNLG